jgi:Stress responsive A/B Barrel Domain
MLTRLGGTMKNAKLFLFGLALSAAALLPSCNTSPFAGNQHGKVNHAVFVWLKKPGNATDRQKLIDTTRMLKREIPEVEALTVGPMLPSKRPIVDSTYDVGFVMRFATQAAMDRYEQSTTHQNAVKNILMPMVKKIQVYDFVTE